MAPEPLKPFRLPVHDAPAARWFLKPGLAMAFLGILIFGVTLWAPRFTTISPPPMPVAVQNFENDNRLMQEIDMLVEDALPAKYQQLAALSDDRSVDDLDAFMDWMVPSPGEADDLKHPAAPDWGSLPQPEAWSEATVHPERETV